MLRYVNFINSVAKGNFMVQCIVVVIYLLLHKTGSICFQKKKLYTRIYQKQI